MVLACCKVTRVPAIAPQVLGERYAPRRPSVAKAPRNSESDEARRIHRDTLLENAAAGWHGAEFRRAASAQPERAEGAQSGRR